MLLLALAGRAPPGHAHIANSTRYSETAQARFSELDSGASAANPIIYAALHPDAPRPARFVGGLPLTNLIWVPVAAGAGSDVRVAGIFKAKVDPSIEFDAQDQLFLFDSAGGQQQEVPLIRGPSKPSSLVRFLLVSQYLLELASGVWALECGVLTSRDA